MAKRASTLPEQLDIWDGGMTIGYVGKMLRESEGHVWDEYFSLLERNYRNLPWPDDYWGVAVYVVTGGSEGYYLHVDILDNKGKREMIFLGKTLDSRTGNWLRCWESAARIAWMLGA